jgi:hypothetical protein
MEYLSSKLFAAIGTTFVSRNLVHHLLSVSPNAGERMVGSASATGLERGMNQQRSTISLD